MKKIIHSSFLAIAIILVLSLVAALFSYFLPVNQTKPEVNAIAQLEAAPEAKPARQDEIPFEHTQIFADIYQIIKDTYVHETDDAELFKNAIKGMLEELDPHSSFLEPERIDNLQVQTSGKFGGLGIQVQKDEETKAILVISPIEGTPAERAGILSGDLIISIDQTETQDISLNDAVKLMRGPIDTDVSLRIYRESLEQPFDVVLTRSEIVLPNIRAEILADSILYIRISSFSQNAYQQMQQAIARAIRDGQSFEAAILDLRFNPGGELGGAIDTSDAFIKEGLIVEQRGRTPDSNAKYFAQKPDLIDADVPMIVLINTGSASGSEIVAGALKDHGRATLLGETTFGKGTVQTLRPVRGGFGIKLTTALYYTPSGKSIQAVGVAPDIEVSSNLSLQENSDQATSSRRESTLSGHIENPSATSSATPSSKADKESNAEKASNQRWKNDYQLSQAIGLLKLVRTIK